MTWQQTSIEQLTALISSDPDVLALIWGGSSAHGRQDQWSDLDVLIVIRDRALDRFFPCLDWLSPLGDIFAYEQHIKPFKWVLRICFSDFRRFDVSITTEANLAQIQHEPECQIIFSRLPNLHLFTQPYMPPTFSDAQFETMVSAFWFKSVMTVIKHGRGDHVIAYHLSLDLMRDCLVLAMLLRDRDGGDWNPIVEQLPPQINILESVIQSAVVFDQLASQWTVNYRQRSQQFSIWLADAKKS